MFALNYLLLFTNICELLLRASGLSSPVSGEVICSMHICFAHTRIAAVSLTHVFAFPLDRSITIRRFLVCNSRKLRTTLLVMKIGVLVRNLLLVASIFIFISTPCITFYYINNMRLVYLIELLHIYTRFFLIFFGIIAIPHFRRLLIELILLIDFRLLNGCST